MRASDENNPLQHDPCRALAPAQKAASEEQDSQLCEHSQQVVVEAVLPLFPEEGKYQLDGHRKCQVFLTPVETRGYGGRCLVRGKPVTVGVMHRVEALADRDPGCAPESAGAFRSLVPRPREPAIVITADHGEGIGQHDIAEHRDIWNEQLRVPLLVRLPGVPPARIKALTSTIDIFPLLTEELGLPIDRSALDLVNPLVAPRTWALSQTSISEDTPEPSYTPTGDDWKVRLLPDGSVRLYDLRNDPHELEDRAAVKPERAGQMVQTLRAELRSHEERGGSLTTRPLDEAERDSLEALGYVE